MQPDTHSTVQPSSTSRHHKKRLVYIILAALLVVAASTAAYVWKTTSDRRALQATVAEIAITQNGFEPATVLVTKGQSVSWINQDSKVHNIAVDQQEFADLGVQELAPGESLNFAFEESGTYTYHDPLNPDTHKGTVIVE